jgi:hypothetical protein
LPGLVIAPEKKKLSAWMVPDEDSLSRCDRRFYPEHSAVWHGRHFTTATKPQLLRVKTAYSSQTMLCKGR